MIRAVHCWDCWRHVPTQWGSAKTKNNHVHLPSINRIISSSGYARHANYDSLCECTLNMLPSQSLYGNPTHAAASLESCDLREDGETERTDTKSFHVIPRSIRLSLWISRNVPALVLLRCSTFSQWTISQAPFLSTADEKQTVSVAKSCEAIGWKSENLKKLICRVLPWVSFLFTTLSALWRFCKWGAGQG